jgi:hypothetical protein
MEFDYKYRSSTSVADRPDGTRMSFEPDLTRKPTYFVGELRQSVHFREAISALHEVVVSNLRAKEKDKALYKEWAASREQVDWQEIAERRSEVADRMKALKDELAEIDRRRHERMGPFWSAQTAFRDFARRKNIEARWLFDPVITVHPDEVFFECFSLDESTYARLGTSYEVFREVGDFSCGTTNVDYSPALYDEFQKIRSYKSTRLEVDPTGFEVQTSGEEAYKEVKIDLPDSWVRGFLQVSSAMSLPSTVFDLDPMDLHNMCLTLRMRRETRGPRSMRFVLTPGEPVRILFEPWNAEVVCRRSHFAGSDRDEIRVWGRRRLLVLERLIPVARRITVHLLGSGLPSFFVVDLGDMSFTLGLSGWTANDWATAGNFDLMAPRADVDSITKKRVFDGLSEAIVAHPDALASSLDLNRATVLGALGAWTQAGRAIFDLNKGVYRLRELSRDPLPLDALRFANPREESATRFLVGNAVRITETSSDAAGNVTILGTVREGDKSRDVTLTSDLDNRILRAACTCNWHQQNKLFKGPCEHILALRMQHARTRQDL